MRPGNYLVSSSNSSGPSVCRSFCRASVDNISGRGKILYDYDSLGQLASVINQDGYRTDYTWQADGQKQSITVTKLGKVQQTVYHVKYYFDAAGRLKYVTKPLKSYGSQYLAGFNYDDNGNRKQLKYWLAGDINGPNTVMDYSYDIKNNLIGIAAANPAGEPNYTFNASASDNIDGLGRLKHAAETISYPGQANRSHTSDFTYNMQSGLTTATISPNGLFDAAYTYKKDGNIERKTTNGNDESYEYDTTAGNDTVFDSDIMTKAGGDDLFWDENGRLITGLNSLQFYYNWDGKLRDVNDSSGNRLVSLKYDPMGNRVYKWSATQGPRAGTKYIVDVSGGLPTILCEIDCDIADANRSITNKYFYANAQILKQEQYIYGAAGVPGYTEEVEVCNEDCLQSCLNSVEDWCFGDYSCCHQLPCCSMEERRVEAIPAEISITPYFYIHDRLGSVRLVVNSVGDVNNTYTYNPFGEMFASECDESVYNPFKFTGQWYDSEIGQYYLRARQYDPALMRFGARDPVRGKYTEPLTLHRYLYCINAPTQYIDPTGEFSLPEILITMTNGAIMGALGGGIEGIISEFMNWDNNGKFDWGNVGIKAGTGAIVGGLGNLYQAAKYGSLVNTSLFKSLEFDYFIFGFGQALMQDFAFSLKGGGGLNKTHALAGFHNMTLEITIAAVDAGW
jgi:RHS repeat-associated protein